jgi:hypothetical protein
MSQALMIRDKENDKVVFEFSRNSEVYQELLENIDFPYNRWEDVNQDQLELVCQRIQKDMSDLQTEIIFTVLKDNDVFEVSTRFVALKELTIVLGKIYAIISYTYFEDCEWCFS